MLRKKRSRKRFKIKTEDSAQELAREYKLWQRLFGRRKK